jgi:ferrochelatase
MESAAGEPKAGVALLTMGGPEKEEEVEPFLRDLFADPDLIRLPAIMRPFQGTLAKRVARKRRALALEMYRQIGFSPLRRETEALARRVADSLGSLGHDIPVEVGMRYTRPRVPETWDRLIGAGAVRAVALPLYPHETGVATGSSISDFRAFAPRNPARGPPPVIEIRDFGSDPRYLDLLASWVQRSLDGMRKDGGEGPHHLLFSAHGLPVAYVRSGDEYPERVREASKEVASRLKDAPEWSVSFQSRVGDREWTRPYTDDQLKVLASKGVRSLLVVGMGFVSDHVETLYEIDILYRDLAKKAGVERFERVPSFNDDPAFASFLATKVLEALGRR